MKNKTNKKWLLWGFVFLITVASLFFALSSSNNSGVKIHAGKNIVSFSQNDTNISISSFYVNSLVKLNPEIQAVSYEEWNGTVGYVNAFGGIGKNFLIQENTKYEIYSSGNATLIFP